MKKLELAADILNFATDIDISKRDVRMKKLKLAAEILASTTIDNDGDIQLSVKGTKYSVDNARREANGNVTLVAMESLKEPEEQPATVGGYPLVYRRGPFAIVDAMSENSGFPTYQLYVQLEASGSWTHLVGNDRVEALKAQIKFLRSEPDEGDGSETDGEREPGA